jgi:hypothetical protein
MKCENAQQNIILAQYGELPDELQFPLEQHLGTCEDCRREWNALLALNEELALTPMIEPSPNLLAASRMRLDEALDTLPPRSISQRFFAVGGRISGREFHCEISGGPCSPIAAAGDFVECSEWRDCECFGNCTDAEF